MGLILEVEQGKTMIKDGMWFEDEEHYRYYLERMKTHPATKFVTWFQAAILNPLIKRAMQLLKEQSK